MVKGRKIILLPMDIQYLEREKRSTLAVCVGETVRTSSGLTELQAQLGSDYFVRCHNSYIVNLNFVKEFCRNELILRNGKKVPISRRYLNDVRRAFARWLGKICNLMRGEIMTVFTGKCIAVLLETVIFYIFAMKCADTGNMDLRKKRIILLLLAVVHGVLMLPVKNGGSAFLVYVAEIILWMAVIYKISEKPFHDFLKFYAFIEFYGIIGAALGLLTKALFGVEVSPFIPEVMYVFYCCKWWKEYFGCGNTGDDFKIRCFEKIPLLIWKVLQLYQYL